MKLFETLAKAIFLDDGKGHTVFYKWGIFGEGRIVDEKPLRMRIVRVVTCYFFSSLALIFLFNVFYLWEYQTFSVAIWLLILVLCLTVLLYNLHIRSLVRNLPKSHKHLTLLDGWRNSAKELPANFLWFSLSIMTLCLIGSLLIAFYIRQIAIYAVAFAAISALGIFAHYKMIRYKRKHPF